MMHKVFVYGTLKPGFEFYEAYLKGSIDYPAEMGGELHISVLGYPIINVHVKTTHKVKGFVVLVDDRMLDILDQVENYSPKLPDDQNHMYVRKHVPTTEGEMVWVYDINRTWEDKIIDKNTRVQHGDFQYAVGITTNIQGVNIVLMEEQTCTKKMILVAVGKNLVETENPLFSEHQEENTQ